MGTGEGCNIFTSFSFMGRVKLEGRCPKWGFFRGYLSYIIPEKPINAVKDIGKNEK